MLHVGDPRGWWLFAAALLVLLVLWLRRRRRRLPTSAWFIVRRLARDLEVAPPRLRWRRRVAQALFTAAVLLAAAAGLAPYYASGARGLRELVIVDLSPSLGVREGGHPRVERLREALAGYARLLQEPDAAVFVAASPQAAASAPLGGAAARAWAAHLDFSDAPADVAGARRIAAALAAATPFDHCLVFTDRPDRWRALAGDLPAGCAPWFVAVGEPRANRGITAFDLVPDPLQESAHDLFVRADCAAPAGAAAPGPADLVVRNNERELVRRRWECSPGRPHEVLLEDLALEKGRVEAFIEPGDDYPADDRALVGVSDAPPLRVVLVTPGNRFLRAALEADAAVQLTVLGVDDRLPRAPGAIFVFDGRVPEGAPADRALLIQPDRLPDGLRLAAFAAYPERIAWEVDDPLLKGVDLGGLTVRGMSGYEPTPIFRAVATADGRPLILVREEGGRREVVLAFDPSETNLVYSPSYPVLLANALRWLGLFTGGERGYLRTGEPVFLPGGALGGGVRTPAGQTVPIPATRPLALPFAEATHPGRYEVAAGAGAALGVFYLNVVDAAVTREPAAAGGAGSGAALLPPGLARPPLRVELAPWLCLLAVALLAAEALLASGEGSRREAGG